MSFDGYIFYSFNQTIYENGAKNENSNIIHFKFLEYQFLLIRDAVSANKKDILDKYRLGNITFLKVWHHGSKTSSSKYFVDKPKISIISVGEENIDLHPNKEAVNNLESSEIFWTDTMGSIEIKIREKCSIGTYAPY